MMTSKFLHGEIREKGGAYGGGARMGGGLFSFYSYRWEQINALIPVLLTVVWTRVSQTFSYQGPLNQ